MSIVQINVFPIFHNAYQIKEHSDTQRGLTKCYHATIWKKIDTLTNNLCILDHEIFCHFYFGRNQEAGEIKCRYPILFFAHIVSLLILKVSLKAHSGAFTCRSVKTLYKRNALQASLVETPLLSGTRLKIILKQLNYRFGECSKSL